MPKQSKRGDMKKFVAQTGEYYYKLARHELVVYKVVIRDMNINNGLF